MIFNATDYWRLHYLFDQGRLGWRNDPVYAGYRPNVRELPNGDGKLDAEKRFLHIALKYNPPEWALRYLARAHFEACRIAEQLGVPAEFYPRVADGTLRVLEYPVGAGTHEHTDFDLFTVNCWRSHPTDLMAGPCIKTDALRALEPGLVHMGELGEAIGLAQATPHHVPGRPYEQYSIVYFAMPDHAAQLPNTIGREAGGMTVGEWLKERKERSRERSSK